MDEIPSGDLLSLTTVRSEEEDGVLSALTLISIESMDEIPLGDLWSLTTVRSEEEAGRLSTLTLNRC
jgi:hypothetical protein